MKRISWLGEMQAQSGVFKHLRNRPYGVIKVCFMSIAAIVCCLLFWKILSEYSYFSLWTDEMHSVVNYSRPGAWAAWTTYHEPNNHILFNIIASLVPNERALDPAWARSPSFAVVFVAFVAIAVFSIREKASFSGLLVVGLFLLNDRSLDLLMEARGYGLVFCAATLQAIFLHSFTKSESNTSLAAFFSAGLVGGATIPIFIIYTGILCVLTTIARPSSNLFLLGLITAIAGALFYAPTAQQILNAWATYGSEWGYNYTGLDDVHDTLRFILPKGMLFSLVTIILIANAPKLIVARKSPDFLFVMIVIASVILFISYCVIQQTPLVRTTQFVVAPLAIVGIVLTKVLVANKPIEKFLTALVIVSLGVTVLQLWQKSENWQYTPRETWRHTAHIVNEIADKNESIFVSFRPQHLKPYLAPDLPISDSINDGQVRIGKAILVDTSFVPDTVPQAAEIQSTAVELILKMRRGTGEQRVIFVPQKSENIIGMQLDGVDQTSADLAMDNDHSTRWAIKKLQTDFDKPVTLTVLLNEDQVCDEFIWYDPNFDIPGNFQIHVFNSHGRKVRARRRSIEVGKNFLFLDLGEFASSNAIEITMNKSNVRRWVSVTEMWCDSR